MDLVYVVGIALLVVFLGAGGVILAVSVWVLENSNMRDGRYPMYGYFLSDHANHWEDGDV